MTILSTVSPDYTHQVNQAKNEQTNLNNLWNLLVKQGLHIDKRLLVHFYVTLKSSKSLLLVGPAQSGKRALVESAGLIFTDNPIQHCQTMVGHARWASQSQHVSLFVEAQATFNMQKLMVLLEESAKPENANRLFIACLNKISPSEIHSLFTTPELSLFQESNSVPFPSNFRLIGTMDTIRFPWWTPELLFHTAIIHWQTHHSISADHSFHLNNQPVDKAYKFLRTCIWREQAAYTRLLSLLDNRDPFRWLIEVVSLLHNHDVQIPREAINQVIIFLANSWTKEGSGLFAQSFQANLIAAFDLALVQRILPWIAIANCAVSALNRELMQVFGGRFPQAATFLQTL